MNIKERLVTAIENDTPEILNAEFVRAVVEKALAKGIKLKAGLDTFGIRDSCGCAVACTAVAIEEDWWENLAGSPMVFFIRLLYPGESFHSDAYQNLTAISDGFEKLLPRSLYPTTQSRRWTAVGSRFRDFLERKNAS